MCNSTRFCVLLAISIILCSTAKADRCEGPHVTIDFFEESIRVFDALPNSLAEEADPNVKLMLDLVGLPVHEEHLISVAFPDTTATCDDRWITGAQAAQWTYTVRMCGVEVEDFKVNEVERRVRILDDFRKLVTLMKTIKGQDDDKLQAAGLLQLKEKPPTPCQELRSSALSKKRGTLTVEGRTSVLEPIDEPMPTLEALGIAALTEDPEQEEEEGTRLSMSLLTGPVERLFLAADAPLSALEEVTIDEETNQLVTRDDPANALLSLNVALNDVHSGLRFNPSLKLMLEASDEPGNTLGAGIGFPLAILGLEPFHIFGAYLWTNDEDVSDDWVVGLSFDLDQLGSWLDNETNE